MPNARVISVLIIQEFVIRLLFLKYLYFLDCVIMFNINLDSFVQPIFYFIYNNSYVFINVKSMQQKIKYQLFVFDRNRCCYVEQDNIKLAYQKILILIPLIKILAMLMHIKLPQVTWEKDQITGFFVASWKYWKPFEMKLWHQRIKKLNFYVNWLISYHE